MEFIIGKNKNKLLETAFLMGIHMDPTMDQEMVAYLLDLFRKNYMILRKNPNISDLFHQMVENAKQKISENSKDYMFPPFVQAIQ